MFSLSYLSAGNMVGGAENELDRVEFSLERKFKVLLQKLPETLLIAFALPELPEFCWTVIWLQVCRDEIQNCDGIICSHLQQEGITADLIFAMLLKTRERYGGGEDGQKQQMKKIH